jgi:hypothetical protein
VDYVPLAINLLAHLAQTMPPSLLWDEWLKKQTRLVQKSYTHRLSNLEYSIQLSIDSERMRAHPSAKKLLGILSMLPDGIHVKQLKKFEELLVEMDVFSNLVILQQCSLIHMIKERFQTHPIIRHFCINHEFVPSDYKASLQEFYITLASNDSVESPFYDEKVLEVNNMKAILSGLLKLGYKDDTKLINAIFCFTEFHSNLGDFSDKLIVQTAEFIHERHVDTSLLIRCLLCWGTLHFSANNFEEANQKLREAEILCSSSITKDISLHAKVLFQLGVISYFKHSPVIAEPIIQKALTYFESDKNTSGQSRCHRLLGSIYSTLERIEAAEASLTSGNLT